MSETHDPETGEVLKPGATVYMDTPVQDAMQSVAVRMSTAIDKIAPAVIEAQGATSNVPRDKENTYHKSKYADLAAFIDTTKVPLHDNGLGILQFFATPTMPNHVRIISRLLHESGQWMESDLEIPFAPGKTASQSAVAASTYGRRVAWAALCGIAPEDDDGETASGRGGKKSRPPEKQAEDFGDRATKGIVKPHDAKGRTAEGTPPDDDAWVVADAINGKLSEADSWDSLKAAWESAQGDIPGLPEDVRSYLETMKNQYKQNLTAAA